jgi:hypothetical protein
MRISKNRVLDFLTRCQIEKGGYTGSDVTILAKSIPVSPQALRKRIDDWNSSDQTFKQLRYLGKQTIPLTVDEFVLIRQWLKENPLGGISDILQELNDNRQKQGKDSIPQSSFYRFVNSQKESLTGNVPRELQWLIFNRIKVTDTYILANARASLSTVFTYTDLKTFGGIDIDGIASRLQEAQKWFQQTYLGTDPFEWFPRIRSRSKVIRTIVSRIAPKRLERAAIKRFWRKGLNSIRLLALTVKLWIRNHLSRIKADKALPFQARLIFGGTS